MGFWKGVLAFLTPKPRRSRHKWDPVTNPFDIKQVSSDLDLEANGLRLGAAGVPQESATTLSGPESEAVFRVDQAQADYIESYQLRLKALDAQISRSDLTSDLAFASASAGEFERRAANLLTDDAAYLRQLEETARSRREAFERFRQQHRRQDLPHYRTGLSQWAKYAGAGALIVIESLLNANFFAQGLTGGFLAGALRAFGCSLVNVLLGLFLGAVAVGYMKHVSLFKRVAGTIGSIAVLGSIVMLAIFVAHYRDALVTGIEGADLVAVQTSLASPLRIASFSSWLLLGLSVLFGVLAAWDGYLMGEPYPGYGRVHRRMVEAVDTYNDAIGRLRDELEKYRQELLDRIDEAHKACESCVINLRGAISDKERLRDEMSNQIASLNHALIALIDRFRMSNIVGRQGLSTPSYFNTPPRLEQRALPDFSIDADQALLAKQEASITRFLSTRDNLRARIQNAFNDRYSSLITITGLFESAGDEPASGKASVALTVAADAPSAEPALSATVLPLRNAVSDGVG